MAPKHPTLIGLDLSESGGPTHGQEIDGIRSVRVHPSHDFRQSAGDRLIPLHFARARPVPAGPQGGHVLGPVQLRAVAAHASGAVNREGLSSAHQPTAFAQKQDFESMTTLVVSMLAGNPELIFTSK